MAKKTAGKKGADQDAPEVKIESAINQTESFIIKNGSLLLTILAVAIVIAVSFYGARHLYMKPRAEKASAAMYVAQQHFAQDSMQLALQGDGNFDGFLQIIKKYGATPAGNVARHYAGVAYMELGQYEEALKMLESYKTVKGVPGSIINAQNLGLQGDANVQMGNFERGAQLYEKAAAASDNSLTTPVYLKKAGLAYEKLGDNAKALAIYKRLSADYPSSLEARDIEKSIGRLEQL